MKAQQGPSFFRHWPTKEGREARKPKPWNRWQEFFTGTWPYQKSFSIPHLSRELLCLPVVTVIACSPDVFSPRWPRILVTPFCLCAVFLGKEIINPRDIHVFNQSLEVLGYGWAGKNSRRGSQNRSPDALLQASANEPSIYFLSGHGIIKLY